VTEDLKARKLTVEDMMRKYEDPACKALGYLGERHQHRYDRRFRNWADVLAVDLANEQEMTYKQFSDWLESPYGHYFGYTVFGGFNHKQAEADARRWHLVRVVKVPSSFRTPSVPPKWPRLGIVRAEEKAETPMPLIPSGTVAGERPHMRSDTNTEIVRRSNPTSERYCLFNVERRISCIVDRRVNGERRQARRQAECILPLSAYLS